MLNIFISTIIKFPNTKHFFCTLKKNITNGIYDIVNIFMSNIYVAEFRNLTLWGRESVDGLQPVDGKDSAIKDSQTESGIWRTTSSNGCVDHKTILIRLHTVHEILFLRDDNNTHSVILLKSTINVNPSYIHIWMRKSLHFDLALMILDLR